MVSLQFGLNEVIPKSAVAAWGARWIYPHDQLWDRQDMQAPNQADQTALTAWLNPHGAWAIKKAMANMAKLADRGLIAKDSDQPVALYADDQGWLIANPRRSHGYVYVAAFLRAHVSAEDAAICDGAVTAVQLLAEPKPRRGRR